MICLWCTIVHEQSSDSEFYNFDLSKTRVSRQGQTHIIHLPLISVHPHYITHTYTNRSQQSYSTAQSFIQFKLIQNLNSMPIAEFWMNLHNSLSMWCVSETSIHGRVYNLLRCYGRLHVWRHAYLETATCSEHCHITWNCSDSVITVWLRTSVVAIA
jgi:hypothetical protein